MPDNLVTQSLCPISGINKLLPIMKYAPIPKLPFFILLIPIIFSMGCAALYRPASPESLSYEIVDLLSKMLDQEEKVSSFYTSGTVLVKGWVWQSEADILIAGNRDPLKIKIEITHPWGKPILHILIDDKRLEILSFDEKRIYFGDLSVGTLSKFLPGAFCDHDLIWSVLRGYPHLARYDKIEFSGVNRISLMNQEEVAIEIIDLYAEKFLPKRAFFPGESLDILFSEFKENNGIYYASEVTVNNIKVGRDLALKRKKIVFNKPIPDQIFILEKPATFDTVYMD